MTRTNPTRPTRLRMPDPVLSALACPVCGNALALGEQGLSCTHGHTFDIAREGYAALLTGSTPPGTGDSKEMITDRLRFQQAGHYDPIGRALAQILDQHLEEPTPLVVDIGGGTGHYLAQVLKALPHAAGLTVDASKWAARRAARTHERGGAVTADVWQGLPLRKASVDVLLNVFAPRHAEEFHRVLRPDGVLMVVVPAADHLIELRGPLGLLEVDPYKDTRLAESLHDRFTPADLTELHLPLHLSHEDITTVVGMGPSAHHLAPETLRTRLADLPDPVPVTASVRLYTYRPHGPIGA